MFMFNYYINFHVSVSNIAPTIIIQHNIGFSSFKKRESGVSRECDMITLPERSEAPYRCSGLYAVVYMAGGLRGKDGDAKSIAEESGKGSSRRL